MKKLTVRDPYTGDLVGELPFATRQEAARVLAGAQGAFKRWKNSSAGQRAALLEGVAADLEASRPEFIELLRKEAGKPVRLGAIEVDRAIGVLKWAAAEALRFSGELLRLDVSSRAQSGSAGFGIHTRFPRGVILGITPFNFPLNLVVHKVAPAIASGCSIVIKPSPATPFTALKLQEIFHAREPGLVSVVLADDETTAELTRAPETAMVSFTGSARVGWQIRRQAPEKPTALELGGNAWVILMPDVPVESYPAIARRICSGAFGYAGQSCISVQNLAVASERWRDFSIALAEATKATAYGDPRDEGVISGPLIRIEAADRVRKELSQAKGWEQVVSTAHRGNRECPSLLSPTLVFTPDADAGMKSTLVEEEIFGPIMIARPFQGLDAVIAKVNSSRYGLQAGIYTRDLAVIEKAYRELEVGGLVVNDLPTARFDHQPYGGVKESGQGREGVRYAMEEMTESRFLALSGTLG